MSFIDEFRKISPTNVVNRTFNLAAAPVQTAANAAGDAANGAGNFFGRAAQGIGKFFGGLVGDQRTNAGLAVHNAGTPASQEDVGSKTFTYRDNNGKQRKGVLYVPYDTKDFDKEDLSNNKGVVSIYGMDLDDGSSLTYEGAVDFLNNVKGFSLDSVSSPDTMESGRYDVKRKYRNQFLQNLRGKS